MERRLAAILAADLVGYTRLMGANETGTLVRLTQLRQSMLEPLIAQHHGRIVKLMGDGLLVEFASVVDALSCAASWQKEVSRHQAAENEDQRLSFRIGINIGDVIIEGEDIYGDGVNVASRLEGLAEPGGICIARNVHDQVKGKVDLAFNDLGEQTIKNVAEPVQVFQVLPEEGASKSQPARSRGRLPAIAAGLLVVLVAGGALFWWAPWAPREEPASLEAMAFPLPDKPSIAVLPFNNMSEDQSQEYFADGMTEDLITDLSKISGLFVIARNSSFSYKGQQVKVRHVAEELGVRYVLEGSVRRAGNQVRINAQLIDATTGGHLWAERYDGTAEDVFDLQDQVTAQIVAALAVSLTGEEQVQQARHATENAEAHDAYLQGWAHYKLGTLEGFAEALPFFEDSLRLDPNYTQAHAALASLYWDVLKNDWAFDLDMPSTRAEERANEHLEHALKVPTPLAHSLQARMFANWGFAGEAIAEAEKAVALDGNDASALAGLADALIKADRAEEGFGFIAQAMRLDPHHPPSYLITLGAAQLGMERYDEAAVTFERAVKRNPESELPLIYLASTYGHLGRIEEADDVIEEANGLRNQAGSGELSLRENTTFAFDLSFDPKIDLAQFGSKPVQDLVRAGLADIPALKWHYLVTIHRVVGPENTWGEVEGATQLDLPTAKAFHDRGAVFIDLSGDDMWIAGRVPGAFHLSWEGKGDTSRVKFSKTTLLKVAGYDDEIVLYFDNDGSSTPVWWVAKALTWGYRNVYWFDGGEDAWKEAGYPVETGE